MTGRISLAQQIALLSETAPTDFDPEDLNPINPPSDDEEQEGTSTAARAHYIDVGPSTLRQINQASISDSKYDGRRVSRKQLVDNDEDQDEDIPSQDDGSDEEPPEGSEPGEDEDEDEEEDRLHEDDDEFSAPSRVRFVNPTPPSEVPSPRKPTKRSLEESEQPKGNQDLASTLRATRETDRKKGKAVTQQIALWDTLLDARIRLQKAASTVNTLPPSQNLAEDPSIQGSLNTMLEEAIALSQDLFNLQDSLFRADGSIPPPKRAKLTHPDPSPRDYSADLTTLSATASAYEAEYHTYLVPTLRKWSAKVQAVAPNVLLPAQRGSFKHAVNGRQGAASVVDVIDDTLRSDAEKLLARTRMSREHDDDDDEGGDGEDNRTGKDGAEAFDDTDFYQQLLRDVIESRGANGEEGEQEWVRRQKARKAKRKKTVDTKASKGRKLRYQVHEKLQNFMVPIPVSHGAWHEEQVDELFASLFSSGM